MKILVFPHYPENPYQELLYKGLRSRGDSIQYLTPLTKSATINLLIIPFRIILWRLRGYTVFHLHWAGGFSLGSKIGKTKTFRFLSYWQYLLCLNIIHTLGYKLVWTAHNILPHETIFPNDVIARRRLVLGADLVIAHSETTLKDMQDLDMRPKRAVVIPIGSFVDVYPYDIDREKARELLKIEEKKFVYLYMGLIREYKGVDDLINAYQKIQTENDRLIIMGVCSDQELKKKLYDMITSTQIIWQDEHVPDEKLQIYFAAADVVVLPFKSITTSSSALLSFSFGKTIIVPSLGNMVDLPETIAYKYSAGDPDALEREMKDAQVKPEELNKKSKMAKEYAESLNWSSISQRTHNAIESLLAS